jgi:hypothetical protein
LLLPKGDRKMKKAFFLWMLLLVTSISCSPPDKSQPQTIPSQTTPKEAQQLDEYENKILDRAETFYNNRMTQLLWVMSILIGIVGVLTPVILSIILEWYRKRSFEKEMYKRQQDFQKYAEKKTGEVKAELQKEMAQPLSVAFLGLAGLFSIRRSPAAYTLMLQSHVLAMKFYIISQCTGSSLTASEIIQMFTRENRGSEVTLGVLKGVDNEIEGMKEDVKNIANDERRKDMESQVKELQIYIHQLIYNKQQTSPQSSSQ